MPVQSRCCAFCAQPLSALQRRFCSFRCLNNEQQRQAALHLTDRFWQKVDRGGDCWLWTASMSGRYGQFVLYGHCMIKAHRFALEEAMGKPIPPGLRALHTCDTPLCVRNDDVGTYELNGQLYPRWGHLWLGTYADNTADMDAKCRRRHAPRKLSPEDICHIRELVGNGAMRADVARLYDVSWTAVQYVMTGRIT